MMNRTLKLMLACTLFSVFVFAQDPKYIKAMEKNIALIDSANKKESVAPLLEAYNGFERIAGANPKEWLPLYYQSFCEVMMGLRQAENGKKDEYFDKAEALINRADSLQPNQSEIYVMRSFVTSMKLTVDPQSRGQQLGMRSGMLLNKAVQLDPENPRAYFLKGQGLLHAPAQWGGGKDKAIPVLETAMKKYQTFKPSSSIMPNWGEARCRTALEDAKKPE